MNSVVKSLWIDPVIGELQTLCINSFILNKVEFHLYTYYEIVNVPEGVIIKDANEILNSEFIFKDNKKSYATFSDWFRIKLLYDTGGWWVDCDVLFVKKFNFKARYVFATESFFFGESKQIRICNAVIKMPKNSSIGKRILKVIKNRLEEVSPQEIVWTEIGAGILTKEIINSSLERYIVIPEAFCPNDYTNFTQVSLNKNLKLDDRTFAVHLWNKMWEWNELDPIELISEGSFLENAKLKFSKI